MVSTVFLMFIHLYYTLSSLEKTPLPPHCILSAPHGGCSTQRSQAACPGMWAGSVFTKTVLFLGSGELIKTPRINSQKRSPAVPSLSRKKERLYFSGVRLLPQIPVLVISILGDKSQITSASNTNTPLLPCPSPRTIARLFSILPDSSMYRAAVVAAREQSGFNYSHMEEFSVLRPSFGKFHFEASHFDFSPAASSKLTTKGWYRGTEINGRIVF